MDTPNGESTQNVAINAVLPQAQPNPEQQVANNSSSATDFSKVDINSILNPVNTTTDNTQNLPGVEPGTVKPLVGLDSTGIVQNQQPQEAPAPLIQPEAPLDQAISEAPLKGLDDAPLTQLSPEPNILGITPDSNTASIQNAAVEGSTVVTPVVTPNPEMPAPTGPTEEDMKRDAAAIADGLTPKEIPPAPVTSVTTAPPSADITQSALNVEPAPLIPKTPDIIPGQNTPQDVAPLTSETDVTKGITDTLTPPAEVTPPTNISAVTPSISDALTPPEVVNQPTIISTTAPDLAATTPTAELAKIIAFPNSNEKTQPSNVLRFEKPVKPKKTEDEIRKEDAVKRARLSEKVDKEVATKTAILAQTTKDLNSLRVLQELFHSEQFQDPIEDFLHLLDDDEELAA